MVAANGAKFNIIIVGAGIAGLCAGVGLAQDGHQVVILESAHELAPIGVGLHIPPNATLVLQRLGLLEKMEADAILPSHFNFRRWADSSVIANFASKQSNQGPSTPYWSMRRSDYQRHLADAAVQAGCTIRLSAKVVKLDSDTPCVQLATGDILNADIIIAADGVKSKLREMIIPECDTSMSISPMSAYRAYVYKTDLLNDPITEPFFREQATNVWLGYNHHFIIYPCGKNIYNIGGTHPSSDQEAMSWTSAATTTEAQDAFRDFDPVVSNIIAMAQDLKQWRLAEVPKLPRWTSKSGKVILVGDAAHGMLQYMAQGAAMATEDAAALVECIRRAKSLKDIPAVTRAFERSRRWRCEVVQASSQRNGDVIHMGDGEEQENRDAAMRGELQKGIWQADSGPWLDDKLRTFLYGHDVIDHTKRTLDGLQL